jgi:hypothetical protein
MRDFKYQELVTGNDKWRKSMSAILEIRSDALRECANAFSFNIERTATFAIMPSEMAFMCRRDQIMADKAVLNVTGKPAELKDFVNDPPDGVWENIAEQFAEFIQLPEAEKALLRFGMGVMHVEKLLAAPHPAMHRSIDALFASVILESWTAFETLSSEVWVQLVNNGPSELRTKVNDSRHVKKGEREEDEKIPLKIDPAMDYAGSLREARRVSFQTLSNIKKYYSVIFEKPVMKRIFEETSGGYIAALSAVRNILTHKAGIVDSSFVVQVKNFPELSTFKDKDPLLLDGGIVKRLRQAALDHAQAIITAADDILSPLPSKAVT